MQGESIEVDYLVVGAGAAGLAFTDSLVSNSDATVLMVDRRHGPGGHWNDAYPFVQLHQPSAYYGVNSRKLGEDRIDERGPNAGFYERASAAEICHYFQAVLKDHLLSSGRVEFMPMTDYVDQDGGASVVSRLTGKAREVTVRRKIVDARYLESSIPATHRASFGVDDGVGCVPVNELVNSDHPANGYVVIGAGKTGMDACNWLLANGVDPDEVTWIKPRESWTLDRAAFQPHEKIANFVVDYGASVEASALATSISDLFRRLEECGHLNRLDSSIDPTMYRGGILSEVERQQLRSIENVIRAGRVRHISTDRIALAEDDVPTTSGRLYLDCTADGLPVRPTRPIFEPDRVTIQQLREWSPTFNASLIGYIEASREDVAEQNLLSPTNTHPNTALDWIRTRHVGMIGQGRWLRSADVADWMESSRLNVGSGWMDHAGEPGVAQAMQSVAENARRAIENLGAFRIQLGDAL